MPDYRWEVAQSQKSGDYWRPKYVPGSIGKDAMSSPSYYVNGAGVRVDPSNPSSWYMLPGGVSASGQSGVPPSFGSASSASGNPFSTITNVKSQPIQDAINKALGNWNTDSTTYGAALDKFQTESDASRAATRGFMDQENANVGGYFNGGVSADLAGILAKAEAANALAADQASNQALRAYKTAGLTGASDVYRTRMIDAALQGIRAQQAKEIADRQQANYQWLAGMQRGLLGQRAGAESAYVDTALKPLTARMGVNQNVLAALGQINAANLANNFYGVNAPYYPSVYGALPTYGGGYGAGGGYGGYPGGYYPAMRSTNVSTVPAAVRSAVANLPPVSAYTYPPLISRDNGFNQPMQVADPMFYGGTNSPGSNYTWPVSMYPGITNEWGDYVSRSGW